MGGGKADRERAHAHHVVAVVVVVVAAAADVSVQVTTPGSFSLAPSPLGPFLTAQNGGEAEE